MSAFYDKMGATALRLIERFGQTITLRDTVPGEYDPVAGQETGEVTRTQAVKAMVLPASKGTVEAFDTKFINDTLIESNLRALKIAAASCEWPPSPGCKVTFDGHDWTMIGVTETSPDGTDLVYSASVMR